MTPPKKTPALERGQDTEYMREVLLAMISDESVSARVQIDAVNSLRQLTLMAAKLDEGEPEDTTEDDNFDDAIEWLSTKHPDIAREFLNRL